MSLTEETRTLGEEFDRLDERLDDVADRLSDTEGGTASGQALLQEANSVETQLGGVGYLIDEYGEEAEVAIAGLDAGEYARVQDRAEAIRSQQDHPGDVPGARSNVFAAMGLVDAPFLADPDDEDDGGDSLDAKVSAVASQPIGVSKWLEAVANSLTTVSQGNFKPLSERLAERSEG